MQATIDQLKNMIQQEKKLSLTQDFSFKGRVLIRKERVLSVQDIDRIKDKVYNTLEIRAVEESSVPSKIKKTILNDIKEIFYEHDYYKGLASTKKKEIEKIIDNTFSHNDYISYALLHIRHFSKKLFDHSVNVAIISLIVDMKWQKRHNNGLIDGSKFEIIFFGGLLHDIGYVTLEKKICNIKKTDRVPHPEFKSHPSRGYELLKRDIVKHQFQNEILNIVLQHEERLDESGFPMSLNGKLIDINAQMVGLCDEFEHLLSGELTQKKRNFNDVSRRIMASQNVFNKDCINVLIEEFGYL